MKLWRTPFDSNPVIESQAQVTINKHRCKGCGFCIEFCPKDVLVVSSELSSKGYQLPAVKEGSICLACGFCELICPEFALKLSLIKKESLLDKK